MARTGIYATTSCGVRIETGEKGVTRAATLTFGTVFRGVLRSSAEVEFGKESVYLVTGNGTVDLKDCRLVYQNGNAVVDGYRELDARIVISGDFS